MPIKVFISYAHESEKLSNSVLDFSNYLRTQGIDAEIDQYEESPPEGWPKWMLRQIKEADYVLVVCTELFFRRVNDFSDSAEGLGVKWETSQIINDLYQLSTNNKKYVPIIFEHNSTQYIPSHLKQYTYYDVSLSVSKERLRDRLLGISKSKRPPLGQITDVEAKFSPLESKERKEMFVSTLINVELWDEAKWRGMVYLSDPSFKDPPIAAFLFDNPEKGNEIFTALKMYFGDVDTDDEIRLSFIEGISDINPLDYKVHISSEYDAIEKKMKRLGLNCDKTLYLGVSKIHEMNPQSGSNHLEVFKNSYKHFGEYLITNVLKEGDNFKFVRENIIVKKRVHFRTKATILDNNFDEDSLVLRLIDEAR